MTREEVKQVLENEVFTKERENVYTFGYSKFTLEGWGLYCEFCVGEYGYTVRFNYSCRYDEIEEIEIEGEEGDHEILIRRLGGISNLVLND